MQRARISGLVLCTALVSMMSAQPGEAGVQDRCTGRRNGIPPLDWACGCHNQVICLGSKPCDDSYRMEGVVPVLYCKYVGYSAEPGTDAIVVVPQQADGEPLWGWADLHEHQFANLAYGGATYWGSPFDGGGINSALPWCDYTKKFSTWLPDFGLGIDLQAPAEPLLRGYGIHGWGPVDQQLYGFTNNMSTDTWPGWHHVGGTGPFDGWPTYRNGGHQQMYHKWLERAYLGGLRVLVNLTVNNEVLCDLSYRRNGYHCGDMFAVDKQIDAIWALEQYVDLRDDGLDNDSGWYRIAGSAQEARDIIEAGAMAVVIGIEVDTPFGCRADNASCDEGYVLAQLDHYYSRGVRYLFPVHFFDNKFSGGSLYRDVFAYANFFATGGGIDTWDCSTAGSGGVTNYSFKISPVDFDSPTDALGVLYAPLVALHGEPVFDPTHGAHCNTRGFTAAGRHLVGAMIDRHMILDINHFSHRAREGYCVGAPQPTWDGCEDSGGVWVPGVMDLLEDRGGARGFTYPVVGGHVGVRPDNAPKSEGDLTRADVARIRDLGGMISLRTPRAKGGGCHTAREFMEGSDCDALGNCAGLGYEAVVELMQEGLPEVFQDYPGIHLQFDFGAFLNQLGPRFKRTSQGVQGCDGGDLFGVNDLAYPFANFDPDAPGGIFDRQKTGDRVFDYNFDGLAHVGLVPDMLADVREIAKSEYGEAVAESYLDPLFNSAETFIRMWERIENCTPDIVPPLPDREPLPDVTGVCSAHVTEIPTAFDRYCTGPVTGTTDDPLDYHDQGTFTVHWTYEDDQGNSTVQTQTVIVDDPVPPTIDYLAATRNLLWPPNHKMVGVTLEVSASDNCDPDPHCEISRVDSSEAQAGTGRGDKSPDWVVIEDLVVDLRAERTGSGDGRIYTIEVTCTDYAGNSTAATTGVVVPHDRRK